MHWPEDHEGVWAAALTAIVLVTLSAAPAFAFDPNAPDPVTATLVAEPDAIAPGQTFTVGLRLDHEPGWHSYWMVPGDSGLPTRIRWTLPAGISAGPLQWPVPHRLSIGPLVDFGYEDQALLLTDLRAAPGLRAGDTVRIQAHAQWLMCRDVCIPGKGDFTVTLPVTEQPVPGADTKRASFAQARAHVPQDMRLAGARAGRSGDRLILSFAVPAAGVPHRLEFFPFEAGRIEPSAPQTLTSNGGRVNLELTAAQPAGGDFAALQGVLVADGGPDAGGWMGAINVSFRPSAGKAGD